MDASAQAGTSMSEGIYTDVSPGLASAYARVERDIPELFTAPLLSPNPVKQEVDGAEVKVKGEMPSPAIAGNTVTNFGCTHLKMPIL